MIRILKPQIRLRGGRWEVVITPPRGTKSVYCGPEGTFAEACGVARTSGWWNEEMLARR